MGRAGRTGRYGLALTRGAGMTVAVVDSGVAPPVLDGHVPDGYDVWDDDPDRRMCAGMVRRWRALGK